MGWNDCIILKLLIQFCNQSDGI